jgi:predicted phage-related endonuclease
MNRIGFIGGSDLYNIMKGDWHDLWLVKTGRKEPDDLSNVFRVNLGVATEDFHIDWFSRHGGYPLVEKQKQYQQNIDGVPYKGQVDALMQTDDSYVPNTILECKHTSSNRTIKDMLENYMPQLHLYMRLSNTHECFLSVIFGNEWGWCRVNFDNDYWSKVHNAVIDFWEMVETQIEPPVNGVGLDKIDWSNIAIDGLVARDASQDNYFVDLAHNYVNTIDAAKDHEAVKKQLRSLINDNEREVYCDFLSIKRDKRGACRIAIKKEAE